MESLIQHYKKTNKTAPDGWDNKQNEALQKKKHEMLGKNNRWMCGFNVKIHNVVLIFLQTSHEQTTYYTERIYDDDLNYLLNKPII